MSTVSTPGSATAATAPADPLGAIADGLFRSMGVDGVYARTALYTHVVERLESYITRQRDPRAEIMRFPPVMSRKQLEKSGYLKSFPNLLGCVCALHGSEASIRSAVDRYDNGGDWTTSVTSSDLVLSPAACYPVYPIVATRGPLPGGGLLFIATAGARLSVGLTAANSVMGDKRAEGEVLLLPIRDLIAPVVWALGLVGSRIIWRGDVFNLKKGRLERVGAETKNQHEVPRLSRP